MSTFLFLFIFFFLLLLCNACYISGSSSLNHHNRRLLHQPLLLPQDSFPPTQSPSSSPPESQYPKLPFSSPSYPSPSATSDLPFFPSVLSPPPPPLSLPPPSGSSLTTLPANISSLLIPQYSHSKHSSRNLVPLIVVIVCAVSVILVSAFIFLFYIRRRRRNGGFIKDDVDAAGSGLDSHRLYPADSGPSDGQHQEDQERGGGGSSATSSEFLYLGTLVNPARPNCDGNSSNFRSGSSPYQKLGSPELHPLPPLARKISENAKRNCSCSSEEGGGEEEEEERFYSPYGGPNGGKQSSRKVLWGMEVNRDETRSSNLSTSYPSSHSGSPTCLASNSSISPVCLSPESSRCKTSSSGATSNVASSLLPNLLSGPPVLVAPSGSLGFLKRTTTVPQAELHGNEEARNPQGPTKLQPLHSDSSSKSSTFILNEEKVEALFVMNKKMNLTAKESNQNKVLAPVNQENGVLDMKKSQNIAVLLRALNVSTEEVCQALLEGNTGALGTALLGSLLRMAPTRDEESKLKEYKSDSLYNLGPAEQFLKAVLDIPFAFKRLDAMLYIANFDSEVEYLRMSFEVLKAACEELRSSKMFLKVLEALFNNVGLNCGNGNGFELDSLLKLIDVESSDGKTTRLHLVVHEITRDDETYTGNVQSKLIDGINQELAHVKKAAEMDYDALTNDVSELARGIGNVAEVVKLNEETDTIEINQRFSESLNKFLKKAEGEIITIQAQKSIAFTRLKEVTAYFCENSGKNEADPFRILRVVNDLLSILNQVCKEVGKSNEQTLINSTIPLPVFSL